MTLITRRSLIHGLLAAPAIVAAERLMPVKALVMPEPAFEMSNLQAVVMTPGRLWVTVYNAGRLEWRPLAI